MDSETLNEQWARICAQVKSYQDIDPSQVSAFFSRLVPQAMSDSFLMLTADNDYSSFLTYYRLMLDMISQALPNTKIYVQSITPVRPEVSQKSPGLYKERLCEINDALSAIALEKGCTFLNLWEALADENGDLIEEYAQPDGYHLLPAGYDAWVDYLCTHT